MEDFRISSKDELEERIAIFMSKAEKIDGIISVNQIPLVFLRNPSPFRANKQGQVIWNVRLRIYGFHAFIELTTGIKKKKTIYIPICLLNSQTRLFVTALLKTSINPSDGRFCSRQGMLIIATGTGKCLRISLDLAPLALAYGALEILSDNRQSYWKSDQCPFCSKKCGE